MTNLSPHIQDKLSRGIAAAKAGQKETAQQLLQEVLAAAPQTIPAMFWLAFVAPNPYDSVRLLERVLNLEPGNQQAQAGLRWARERLQTAAPEPKRVGKIVPLPLPAEREGGTARLDSGQSPAAPPQGGEKLDSPRQEARGAFAPPPVKPLRQSPASKPQKPVVKARPRRARWLLGAVVVGALLLVGLLVLGGEPGQLVSAWWPNTSPAPVAEPVVFVEPTAAQAVAAEEASQTFATAMDTIIMQLPEMSGVEAVELPETSGPGETDFAETQPIAEAAMSVAASSVAPSTLIGPGLALASTQLEPEPTLPLAHQPAYRGEKWIEVNVTTQQVTAWEGDQPVFTFIASTGLPATPTVLGEFNIYWKLESTLMTGPDYYLPEVPYTMYFFRGYALHGAYWHNNFGQPMSHGCVNLENSDAQKLFEWADPVIPPGQTQVVATADNPGTLVVVHD